MDGFARRAAAAAAGLMGSMFGPFDHLLRALVVFMAIDAVTGMAACVVGRLSGKEGGRGLESGAALGGLIKKGMCLTVVAVGVHLDLLLETGSLARDAMLIAFVVGELISIIENMGRMGIKMPPIVSSAVEVLGKKR